MVRDSGLDGSKYDNSVLKCYNEADVSTPPPSSHRSIRNHSSKQDDGIIKMMMGAWRVGWQIHIPLSEVNAE
jgi:hypothetical protein